MSDHYTTYPCDVLGDDGDLTESVVGLIEGLPRSDLPHRNIHNTCRFCWVG